MNAPLTLIVEGKPQTFDNPVPVGEVIPAGTHYVWSDPLNAMHAVSVEKTDMHVPSDGYLTARPPVAPESFADGDVAWVPFRRTRHDWATPDGATYAWGAMRRWLDSGTAYLVRPSRPESLADVLDDLGLTDEQRARVEKAVGGA